MGTLGGAAAVVAVATRFSLDVLDPMVRDAAAQPQNTGQWAGANAISALSHLTLGGFPPTGAVAGEFRPNSPGLIVFPRTVKVADRAVSFEL